MQAHVADARAALAFQDLEVVDVDAVAEAQHALAGPRARGDAASDRGGIERGEERLLLGEPVPFYVLDWMTPEEARALLDERGAHELALRAARLPQGARTLDLDVLATVLLRVAGTPEAVLEGAPRQ